MLFCFIYKKLLRPAWGRFFIISLLLVLSYSLFIDKDISSESKVWLVLSYWSTIVVTIIIIFYSLIQRLKRLNSASTGFEIFFWIIFLILFSIPFLLIVLDNTNKWERYYEIVPIALVIIILFFDIWLSNDDGFCKLKDRKKEILFFDFCIILLLFCAYLSKFWFKSVHSEIFASGFYTGASAFQLIFANIVFPAELYEYSDTSTQES